jgi:uncharacterized membrane protein YfcA
MDFTLLVILAGTVIAGFVQGLSGFAFTMTAMAIWAWTIDPQLATATAVFGGMAGQMFGAILMRRDLDLPLLTPLLIGAAIGMPIGVAILPNLDAHLFKVILGAMLTVCCTIMLFADRFPPVRTTGHLPNAVVGFVGGIMGGIGGFTGITPTLWYTLRRFEKIRLRSVVQNFNLVVLTATMIAYVVSGNATAAMIPTFAIMLPAMLIPWWLGSKVYLGMSDQSFRRVVLGLLALSGVAMLVSSLPAVISNLY